jgi:hypothetical protein
VKGLSLVLKVTAPIFLFIGVLHLTVGPNADVTLGANIPLSVIGDPVLDSQNRFFGVSFAIYGVLFYLCATDLTKYEKVFYCLLAVFFAGGIARLVSMAVAGMPSIQILVLTGLELLIPPLLVIWYKTLVGQALTSRSS